MDRSTLEQIMEQCKSNPHPIPVTELVSSEQSFSGLLFYLCKSMSPRNILEWGPGQSTNVFLRATNDSKIVSVEELPEWYQTWKVELQRKDSSWLNRVDFLLRPHNNSGGISNNYVHLEYPDGYFDIALVDGGDRPGCVVEAERLVRPGGVILCHDTEIPTYFDIISSFMTPGLTEFYGDHTTESKQSSRTSIWIRR